jgi:hypothetical protein
VHVVRTYTPGERPDVEVLVDGQWWPGELRQWSQDEEGNWWANVTWRREPGHTHIDTVPAEQVRPVQTDFSREPPHSAASSANPRTAHLRRP